MATCEAILRNRCASIAGVQSFCRSEHRVGVGVEPDRGHDQARAAGACVFCWRSCECLCQPRQPMLHAAVCAAVVLLFPSSKCVVAMLGVLQLGFQRSFKSAEHSDNQKPFSWFPRRFPAAWRPTRLPSATRRFALLSWRYVSSLGPSEGRVRASLIFVVAPLQSACERVCGVFACARPRCLQILDRFVMFCLGALCRAFADIKCGARRRRTTSPASASRFSRTRAACCRWELSLDFLLGRVSVLAPSMWHAGPKLSCLTL